MYGNKDVDVFYNVCTINVQYLIYYTIDIYFNTINTKALSVETREASNVHTVIISKRSVKKTICEAKKKSISILIQLNFDSI